MRTRSEDGSWIGLEVVGVGGEERCIALLDAIMEGKNSSSSSSEGSSLRQGIEKKEGEIVSCECLDVFVWITYNEKKSIFPSLSSPKKNFFSFLCLLKLLLLLLKGFFPWSYP